MLLDHNKWNQYWLSDCLPFKIIRSQFWKYCVIYYAISKQIKAVKGCLIKWLGSGNYIGYRINLNQLICNDFRVEYICQVKQKIKKEKYFTTLHNCIRLCLSCRLWLFSRLVWNPLKCHFPQFDDECLKLALLTYF